jgi:hypothetical protein
MVNSDLVFALIRKNCREVWRHDQVKDRSYG